MRLIRLLKYDLKQEIKLWVEKDIISIPQAESLCHLYGMDYYKNNHSYAYSVLIILGYLFIGLAVITLLSANWDEIPRGLRMAGLILITLGINVGALYQYQQNKINSAIGWFFLGSLLYGASIMLIAQIYHLGEHFPDGIFWWTMGILPLAMILQSFVLMLLATTLAFTWFFVETSMNFYPTLFPLFLLFLFEFLRRSKVSYLLFIALITGVGLWLEINLAWWLNAGKGFRFDEIHIIFSIGLFLIFYALAKFLMQQKQAYWVDYGTLLSLWCLRFGLLFLLIFSFADPWKGLLLHTHWQQPLETFWLSMILALIAIALAHYANKNSYSVLIFTLLYLISVPTIMLADNRDMVMLLQIADNLLLMGTGIWLIIRGLDEGISHYFFLGLVSIMLLALLRYINLIGDYVGASMLFIIFAVILLSAAKYWQHQQNKRLIQAGELS